MNDKYHSYFAGLRSKCGSDSATMLLVVDRARCKDALPSASTASDPSSDSQHSSSSEVSYSSCSSSPASPVLPVRRTPRDRWSSAFDGKDTSMGHDYVVQRQGQRDRSATPGAASETSTEHVETDLSPCNIRRLAEIAKSQVLQHNGRRTARRGLRQHRTSTQQQQQQQQRDWSEQSSVLPLHRIRCGNAGPNVAPHVGTVLGMPSTLRTNMPSSLASAVVGGQTEQQQQRRSSSYVGATGKSGSNRQTRAAIKKRTLQLINEAIDASSRV